MSEDDAIPEAVRRAYCELDRVSELEPDREMGGALDVRPLSGGLLHRSLLVRNAGRQYVLQRVSDVFAPEIQDNIAAVTAHLSARGLATPTLLPTRTGAASVVLEGEGRWRLMPFLGGASFERLASIEQAASAGRLIGRFHAALRDFEAPLAPMGIPYRDTPVYLAAMRRALAESPGHRLLEPARALGERVLAAFEELGAPARDLPERVIHGDLKLANVLFEDAEPPGRDRAFALVDLDTLMRGPLWMELGDVWRSWCNVSGEEGGQPRFDMAAFEASLRGFVEGHAVPLEASERESLATAAERITLEVCARFVTDALEESYFAWDASRYPAAGEHNLSRAESQWQLYLAQCATRAARLELLRAIC